MGNTVEQTIKIREIVDVKEVLKGLGEVQDALGKLSLNPTTQSEFNKIFQKIEQNAEKANRALASGFKNKGDVKAYTDAVNQISTAYDAITTKIKILNSTKKVNLEFDDTKIKMILGEIDTLTTKVKTLQNSANQAGRDLGKTLNKAAENHKGGAVSWNAAVKAFEEGKIQETENAIKNLERAVKGAQTRAGNSPLSDDWQKKADDVKAMREAFDKYIDAQSKLSNSTDVLKQKQQEADIVYAEGAKVLTEAAKAGEQGAKSFKEFARDSAEAAKGSQQLNSELDHFKGKAAYFFGITNAINLFKRAVRSAYNTVKDLDAVMTETAVVTNFSVGDMWSQLPEYTERANELGVTIHDTYEAATLFYQQGLKTNEVMQISNETLKMARIAGLDAATASDRMTNALRGFNMELDKTSAQRVNDVYSKLAAITASNTDEISTAMTKVASLAHNANMEFETTAAFLAQIIESTRESAETAGTALKTVVARFSEVKKLYTKGELLGQDEEGEEIDVNKVSTALRSAGINLNEYLTGAKGLDDIFIELAEKWDSLDQVQQRYIATMAAGSRQQSRFIALMSNYKRTAELVEAANNANGASQEQYGKTLESLQTKLARLKNAWNEFILGLANSEAIKKAVDLLTGLITVINDLIKLVSGKNAGVKMITTFLTAFATFKIGRGIVGRSSGLSNFFGRLVGDSQVFARGSAIDIAKGFYTTLATNIANFGKKPQTSAFSGLKNYFTLQKLDDYFISDTSSMQSALYNNLDSSLSTKEQYAELWHTINDGNLTVGELNQALEKSGQTFRVTGENASQFGIRLNNDAIIMRSVSVAAIALGGALMAIGSTMEQQEGPMKDFGSLIKGLGLGLVTFGTIMSVWLPLQAELMKQGITSAIVTTPIVGWIVGIISTLIALGVAFYNIAKNNSLETKLENATESAKKAREAANEAKDAYEKLGRAWDDLSDKYEVIENATKGTQEWRDAIREVNDAVLELYDTYDNVEFERDENGILHIINQDEIDERERLRASNAAAAQRVANIKVLETQNEIDYAEITKNSEEGEFYKEIIDAKIASGDIESLIYAKPEEIQQLVADEYAKRGIDWTAETADVEGIQEYAKNYRYTQEKIAAENLALGSTILNEAGIDQSLQKYANNLLDNDYLYDLEKKTRERINEEISDRNPEDLEEEYAKKRGYANFAAYKDANPDEEKTRENMRDYIVGAEVTKEAVKEVQAFASNVAIKLNDTEKAMFAEKEGGALSRSQALELDKYNDKQIEDIYNRLGGEEILGDLDDFIAQFRNDVQIALEKFSISDLPNDFTKVLSEGLDKNLSSDTFDNLINNLWSVYSTSGEEGVKKIQSSILRLTNEMDPEKVDGFVKSINGVNWASADSIETLKDLAKEYGISEEEVKVLEDQLIEFNNAVKQVNLEQVNKGLALVQKIASGEQGRSFSKEDYEAAIANGADPDDFKYNIATEAYDYIGSDIQDVSAAIREGTNQIIAQLDKEYASALAFEKTQNSEWAKGNNWTGSDSDLNNKEKLRSFLNAYNNEAGEDSLVDRDFIFSASLEQLQEKYQEIEQLYNSRNDIKQNLEDVTSASYQTKSGADLAALANAGDVDAEDTLKQQVINSGLSEAVIQALLEGIESGDMEKITAAGGVVDTIKTAGQYGISTEDLEAYVTALRTVDELQGANEATLYGLALANANYQEGFKSVIESYEEWIELKQEDGSIRAEDGNEEQLKAFDKLKKDLKQMFNLTEDVSDEFFKSAENVELLEAAVNGDTEAVSKLRAELAKTKIDLVINDENVKNQVYALFDNIIAEAGTLEFGASLDMAPAMQALQQLLEASGVTVSEMAEIFESFGWTPEVTEKAVPFTSFQQMKTQGYQEVVDPVTHETVPIPTEGEDYYVQDGMILVPVFGGATFTPPEIPSFSPSTSSGGGGGGGSEKKPSYWKNPYDELYNLQEKINEALRKREELERRYQKLLKQEQATLSDIRKSYYDQIEHLGTEADLQKQLAEGRLRQIKKLGNELYTDEDGDRVSYKEMGVTKYASYDEKTGLIKIDWNTLEEISNDSDRTEEGKAAEEYISKLEELVSSYEEVRDKLWEIEDAIEQLREDAIQSYISFEDRVMDALINQYQKQIDSYQSMSDALKEANNEVLDSLREQIDLSRQIRDNTEKEQDIADMENRLAYLQRDTSGANDLEILKLQKNLDDARQSYTDTLIDQAISNMEKDASLAAEQRTKQIQIMQAQLDMAVANGTLWKEVHDIINDAADENGALSPQSNLIKLLEESEGYKSLSAIGKEDWLQKAAEEFHKAWVGLNEAEDKFKVDANSDGTIYNTSTPTENTNSNNSGFKWDTTEKRKHRGDGKHKWSAFKTGGLADYTGPAWLDGTKTNPELILNAQDSANFIALKDILASLLNIQGANGKVGKGGDNYFDIDISATLESDYDVDKLTEKIKRDIYNDGQYRNVNTINYLR